MISFFLIILALFFDNRLLFFSLFHYVYYQTFYFIWANFNFFISFRLKVWHKYINYYFYILIFKINLNNYYYILVHIMDSSHKLVNNANIDNCILKKWFFF